ncbi:hypothetical protein EOS_35800 [Caballeronia mineralivorans PML1(12)]|uniref:Translocator protein BipB-like C-terminal domain-containing protein n=1 Tax=Caballeronia mineralivorans PML1(12) TaxID=908627 RepID=A0A0J1CLY9_9BURK|nr:type III secretion system translocon subunit SctE [Caballeronia mineralivorans]KLU21529.1 hypothetical protein EOS_35800 [Caballeronia mineralivorans PML1(12)]
MSDIQSGIRPDVDRSVFAGYGSDMDNLLSKPRLRPLYEALNVSAAGVPRTAEQTARLVQSELAGGKTGPEVRVTRGQAVLALSGIFSVLGVPDPEGTANNVLGTEDAVTMGVLAYVAANAALDILGDRAKLMSVALDIQTDREAQTRLADVKKLNEQDEAARASAEKARKGGIVNTVLSWAIGAAEVTTGAVKLVMCDYAGGTADLMAGITGLTKAALQTAALVDEKNAKEYLKVAEIMGEIQMGFEIASALIDVVSVARILDATSTIGLKLGEPATRKLLTDAIASGVEDQVSVLATQIGDDVADQVSKSIAEMFEVSLAQTASKKGVGSVQILLEDLSRMRNVLAKEFAKPVLKAFSKEAIAAMVKESIETAAFKVMRKGATLTEEVCEQAVKDAVRTLNRKVAQKAVQIQFSVASAVRLLAGSAQQITSGVIAIERAKLQKVFDQLGLDAQFLQYLTQYTETEQKQTMDELKSLLERTSSILEGANRAGEGTRTALVGIAASFGGTPASMVGIASGRA